MKNILSSFALFVLLTNATAQAPRLIVRGDDMGYSHSGNEALIKCYKEGFQTSIEVIVASPWFPEAVKMLQANPSADVGIHLALSSEWENVKWRPLTDCPSLRNAEGYFFPMIYPNKNYPGQALTENKWNAAEIEKEFRAQIELAIKKIPHISHISSHMGCVEIAPEIKAVARKLSKEYHIDIDLTENNVTYAGYAGAHGTLAEKTESFIAMLNTLQPGKTYLFVDHPGLDNAELRSVFHIGYENVAADRQGVTDLFTSERVRAAIKAKGIQLISYKDLLTR